MENDLTRKSQEDTSEAKARREFLKKVGQSSVAVPAAALLLAASQEKAQGAISGHGGSS